MDLIRKALAQYRNTLAEDRRVLFDRYRLVDVAVKVVGIGSVGTLCMVLLMMSIADHPFFLQIKEANASVLEAVCWQERLRPPRRACGSGSAADAAGLRSIPRMGYRTKGSPLLPPPTP